MVDTSLPVGGWRMHLPGPSQYTCFSGRNRLTRIRGTRIPHRQEPHAPVWLVGHDAFLINQAIWTSFTRFVSRVNDWRPNFQLGDSLLTEVRYQSFCISKSNLVSLSEKVKVAFSLYRSFCPSQLLLLLLLFLLLLFLLLLLDTFWTTSSNWDLLLFKKI